MGERRGTKGLELWCKRMTEGYPGVKVDNMTTSWRDGLAFCAIIHHFRPDLIDFSKLNKNDIYQNNKLAFRVAEDHLGIPALLEPEDMVEYSVPDRLSILTYLSQFYQAFAVNRSNPPVKTPSKRPPATDIQMHMVSGTSSTPPKKAVLRISGARREPCAKCGLPVFIAERLNVGDALYHRTCFRCARCESQLTLMNYYETENGEFCCETCPDEEEPTRNSANILSKSLSDEEKSAGLKSESDIFSSKFENALEHPSDDSLRQNFTLDKVAGAAFMKARSSFMTTQMDLSDSDSGEEQKPPDLPTSQIPHITQRDGAHIENINTDGVIMLPTFSDSNSLSSKLKTRTVIESHDAVTKDSISVKDEPAMSSFKSRISLFEDIAGNSEIRKSDVNREYPRLVRNIEKVPYANCSEELDEIPKPSSDGRQVDQSFEHLKNETFDESKLSEYYQADTSNLYEACNEPKESVIESLVYTTGDEFVSCSSIEDKIITRSSSAPQESVITLSSEFSFNGGNDNSASFQSSESSVPLKKQDEPIIISSTDSSCVHEIEADSSTDAQPANVNQESVSNACDINEQSSDNAELLPSTDPEHLENSNPFGSDDDDETDVKGITNTSKSTSLNPFDDTDDEEEEEKAAAPTKSTSLNPFDDTDDEKHEEVKRVEIEKPVPVPRLIIPPKNMNPFDSDDEDVEEAPPPQPAVRKLIKAKKISLTPFWQDEDSPVPKARSPAKNASSTPSLTGSGRKKKPAPKPPTAASCFNHDVTGSAVSSVNSSPCPSVCPSPKPSAKTRKIKKAPPPPSSTPLKIEQTNFGLTVSPIEHKDMENKPLLFRVGSAENLKSAKDEMNRNKQNIANSPPKEGPSSLPNKSTYGKWKKRKGQAPVRPIPQRRTIKNFPLGEIKHELELIEIQQLGLEKQGVMLEKLIRERSEVPGTSEDEMLAPETQDMIIQLFDLVNEKNELFRKQTELMYLRRQHRLEEEYAEVEYQIRCLMLQPESNRTDSDKEKEDALINRLLNIVERRNSIVDCVEMDRQRAADEDSSIHSEMSSFKMKLEDSSIVKKKTNKKDKSKTKKDKEKKSKSKCKVDVDKDIDETETSKEKKKKKFNIF